MISLDTLGSEPQMSKEAAEQWVFNDLIRSGQNPRCQRKQQNSEYSIEYRDASLIQAPIVRKSG